MKVIQTEKYAQVQESLKRELGLKLLHMRMGDGSALTQIGIGWSRGEFVPPHLIEEAIGELDEEITVAGFDDPQKSRYYQRLKEQLQREIPRETADMSQGFDGWIN